MIIAPVTLVPPFPEDDSSSSAFVADSRGQSRTISLRLAAEVERQADARGLWACCGLIFRETEELRLCIAATGVLMTGDRSFLNRFPSEVPTDVAAEEAHAATAPLWTDRFSNLIGLLKNW